MTFLAQQRGDLYAYSRLVGVYRKWEWLLTATPIALQHRFHARHRIVSRQDYFDAVMSALGITPKHDLEFYRVELIGNVPLREAYESAVDSGAIGRKYRSYSDRFANEANLTNYYAMIRELRPSVVVETGTASGSMTSWILAAIERNDRGRLVSIDMPPEQGKRGMDITVATENIGFLIPHASRANWELRLGDAKELLFGVLGEGDVDVFVHDSLHTRTHMSFEYGVARALMRDGAVILSDDILWNRSWFDFVNTHRLNSLACIANPNLGFTVNRFDPSERLDGHGQGGFTKLGRA